MQDHTKEMLEQRKKLLAGRTEKENYNIIRKIDRKIRKLSE